eukprot:5280044-Amphidinium_carterae.1
MEVSGRSVDTRIDRAMASSTVAVQKLACLILWRRIRADATCILDHGTKNPLTVVWLYETQHSEEKRHTKESDSKEFPQNGIPLGGSAQIVLDRTEKRTLARNAFERDFAQNRKSPNVPNVLKFPLQYRSEICRVCCFGMLGLSADNITGSQTESSQPKEQNATKSNKM